MREIFSATLPDLPAPPAAERAAAAGGAASQVEHDRWMAAWPCLGAVELVQPPVAPPGPGSGPVTVCAWNIERCKHVEAAAALLAARGAGVVLATEMDRGMARAGQRHTTAELARLLGMGWAFAVEFVELGLGDDRERAACAGQDNAEGLHGNAILSRWPILRAAMIPLDDGGAWFRADLKQGQRRVGGRNAVAALIAGPAGPFWAAAVHFESESTPDSRAAEARRLLAGLDALGAAGPAVIGGDLNTRDAPADGSDPAPAEPAFAAFAEAGFDWRGANAPGATTRNHPWQPQDRPGRKLDWLLLRGTQARAPWIAPALGPDGAALSDHEAIGATLA